MTLSFMLRRIRIDPYLIMLVCTVALAALLPARGTAGPWVDRSVYAAVAALFFLYGARLSPQAVLEGLSHWRLQSLVFTSTFILFPMIGLAATAVLRPFLPKELSVGLMFVCVLPSTVQSSIAFTSVAKGNVSAALCSASVSNLLGFVLTPALVALLLGAHGAGISLNALEDIGLQLLLPFLIGQALRPLIGPWLLQHKRLTAVVDRGSVLLVVYAAFSAAMVAGIWSHITLSSLGLVLLLDICILAIVLVLTAAVSRWLSFSVEDEIAIVFCGSKKSMAGGIPMAQIEAVSSIICPAPWNSSRQLYASRVDPTVEFASDPTKSAATKQSRSIRFAPRLTH